MVVLSRVPLVLLSGEIQCECEPLGLPSPLSSSVCSYALLFAFAVLRTIVCTIGTF